MRSALEWFQTLPEPYQSQAIENARNRGRRFGEDRLSVMKECLASAISGSFAWLSSPEGDEYWRILHTNISSGNMQLSNPIRKQVKIKGFGVIDKRFIIWSQKA